MEKAMLFCVPGEVIGVDLGEAGPLFREVIKSEDRGDRTNGYTSAAIDALHRIDIKLGRVSEGCFIFPRVNAIDGACIDTRCVFDSDAGFGDYIGHLDLNFHLQVKRSDSRLQ